MFFVEKTDFPGMLYYSKGMFLYIVISVIQNMFFFLIENLEFPEFPVI